MSSGNTGALHYDTTTAALKTAQRQLRDAQLRVWMAASEPFREGARARGIAHIRVSGETKRRRSRIRWRIVALVAVGMTVAAALSA